MVAYWSGIFLIGVSEEPFGGTEEERKNRADHPQAYLFTADQAVVIERSYFLRFAGPDRTANEIARTSWARHFTAIAPAALSTQALTHVIIDNLNQFPSIPHPCLTSSKLRLSPSQENSRIIPFLNSP